MKFSFGRHVLKPDITRKDCRRGPHVFHGFIHNLLLLGIAGKSLREICMPNLICADLSPVKNPIKYLRYLRGGQGL